MEIRPATEEFAKQHADDIPDLVWATGPIAYEFQFGSRAFLDAVVRQSWTTPGTLFAADATRLAVEGDTLLGMEIGFHAPEFRKRGAALAPCFGALIERGDWTQADVDGLLERAAQAAWLNPVTRPGRYYIHALAVKPEQRGKKIGVALIEDAMRRGREAGFGSLELDVLSDNPAVRFYRSMGLELYAETRAPAPEAYGVPPECRMGRKL